MLISATEQVQPAVCYNQPVGTREYRLIMRSAIKQIPTVYSNQLEHDDSHVRSATEQVPAVYNSQLKHEDSNAEISHRTSPTCGLLQPTSWNTRIPANEEASYRANPS